MTVALQEAFEKAAALPLERQETIAAVVLEEIEAEDRWQRSFAQSQDVLSKLAAEALAEDAQGSTLPMDEGP
jgi:predicted amidophosphoribosyltransferase